MSLLAQAAHNRALQLAATAVVSGAVAAGLLLGVQQHVRADRVRRLKRAVEEEEQEEAHKEGEEHHSQDLGHDLWDVDDPEERRALALARRAQRGDYSEEVVLEQLTRNRAFLTAAGLERVRGAAVVVVGCGGVGSHCAAALARSGVGRLRLVDFDQVSLSSLNRHAVATLADVGRPKVHVLARRLLAVAPWVRFDLRRAKFDAAAAEDLLGAWVDEHADGASEGASEDPSEGEARPLAFVVDAIDNIDTKVALLAHCHARGLPVVASMGAGTKSDPTRVVVGDIGASAEDRLSRATRRRLKLRGITSGIPAVYSTETAGAGKAALLPLPDEQLARGKDAVRELGALPDFRVRILPVLGTMPAVFGYTLANHILLTLSGYPHEYAAVKGRDKLYDQILAAVHGFEERLVRHLEGEAAARTDSDDAAAAAGATPSLAVGLRVPLTPGDVAFLLEEIYRGRSAVSGLPTRTTLVRWQRPAGTGQAALDALVMRVQPAAGAGAGAGTGAGTDADSEQRSTRLARADLVCMTREEASRHQEAVLLRGEPPASLYDAATLARIDARRREAAAYDS